MSHNQQITAHFRLSELLVTSHEQFAGKNIPNEEQEESLVSLASLLLEPIRMHFGRPVIVTSGFRSKALNAAIKGSPTSQHMKGEAADFHVSGVALKDVYRWVAFDSGLDFGQIILESHGVQPPSWIHLSLGYPWRKKSLCMQKLRFFGGKTTTISSPHDI